MSQTAVTTRVFPYGLAVRRNQLLAMVYLGFAAAMLYPVFAAGTPGLVDYPNHIARIHILGNLDTDPALAANYRANWGIMPNLAMDVLLSPFAKALPANLLGRIFVGATMLMLMGGTAALARAVHGRLDYWPALAALLSYNHILAWGFVNYLFGVGLYLFAFAAWIASRDRPLWLRLTFFSAVASMLFFAHLFALAVYGLSVAAWEAGRLLHALRGERRAVLRDQVAAAGQFALPALIALASMPGAQEQTFLYGHAADKVRALLSPLAMYGEAVDLIAALFFVTTVLVVGRLSVPRSLRLPLLAFVIAAIAMPYRIIGAWGAVSFADMRLPVVIAILLVVALPHRAVGRRSTAAVLVAAAALMVWRASDVTERWQQLDRQFAEYRRALSVIEPGATLLPAQWARHDAPGTQDHFPANYFHIAAFATIDRAAFVPQLFTDPVKQPVAATPRRVPIDSTAGNPASRQDLIAGADQRYGTTATRETPRGSARYWLDWPHRFDYVAIVHFGDRGNPFPDLLSPVAAGSFFDIYKVRPATCVTLDVKDIPGSCWPDRNAG